MSARFCYKYRYDVSVFHVSGKKQADCAGSTRLLKG
jgi:hypothetical protein